MLVDCFASPLDGRLDRFRFTVRMLGLLVHTLLAVLTLVALLAIGAHYSDHDGLSTFLRREAFQAVLLLSATALTFGLLNVFAKRARDVGLPGWSVALGASAILCGVAFATFGMLVPVALAAFAFAMVLVALPSEPDMGHHYDDAQPDAGTLEASLAGG